MKGGFSGNEISSFSEELLETVRDEEIYKLYAVFYTGFLENGIQNTVHFKRFPSCGCGDSCVAYVNPSSSRKSSLVDEA